MARQPRLAAAGHVHHVLQRGHNEQAVFLDDEDRGAFVALLRHAASAEQVAVHGYVLLDNEVQLLVTPPGARSLSRLMQAVGRGHGARFNRRHGHVGTLWAGRFRASIIEPDRWLLRCLCFVEGTASRSRDAVAGAVAPWSSAPHHLGLRREGMLSEHAAYWSLGNTPFERESAWRQLLERGLTDTDTVRIARALRTGAVLGGTDFQKQLAAETGRSVVSRPVGRPART